MRFSAEDLGHEGCKLALELGTHALDCEQVYIFIYLCVYVLGIHVLMCLKEGNYQLVVIYDASDVIEYVRRTPELAF